MNLNATVKSAGNDNGPGAFEAVVSNESLDRDGEVVARGAFNPLPASVPIHVDHKMTSEGLVGSGRPFYDAGGVLKVAGVFAGTPRAQVIRQLVVEGHLSSMSVGFHAATFKDVGGVRNIVKAELLEVSFVSVPSNREARVLTARGYSDRTTAQQTSWPVMKARMVLLLAETELAMIDHDRTVTPQAKARRAVADARLLLAQLKGTR
jgi:HK97 family phage prohead protease